MSGQHEVRLSVKVYLEDTDAQGIVYHANYLKYFERTRTETLDTFGIGLAEAQRQGFSFVVHKLKLEFHKPARLGDRLEIVSHMDQASPYRLVFVHRAFRQGETEPLCSATADVACIDAAGALVEIGADLQPVRE